MIINRRDFIRLAGVGAAGLLADTSLAQYALAQSARPKAPLLVGVEAACRRLAGHGWRDLLLAATGNELDLAADDLADELAKKLTSVRRDLPGFEDFALEGQRGVEPGRPARSLIFHALASPAVLQGAHGKPLTDFPTLAELEAVENYVYGVKPPTLDELRARAAGAEIAVVVFSPEYRTVSHTVLRRHADMAFSRTACARVGNVAARYDGRRRDFQPLDAGDPHAFRVMPARFAPYVAMKVKGQANSFGPMRFIEREKDPDKKGDDSRDFWVPLHKLFSGPECVAGLDLDVRLAAKFVNQKLRRFHELMLGSGLCTGWGESDIDKPPFVMTDRIADFSARGEDGQGLITPLPHPLFERAKRDGKLLAFWVPKDYNKAGVNLWFSTMQVLPEYGETTFTEAYMDGLNVDYGRPAPEYVNTRRRLRGRRPVCNNAVARQATAESAIEDLNGRRDLLATLNAGGYWSLHYVDHTADGWVAAVCPQLAALGNVPAYAPVAPPDFFPAVLQRELMDWWENEAPPSLRPGLWSIDPLALSDTRLPANIELADAGSKSVFSIDDDTVTAIVGHPAEESTKQLQRLANEPTPFTRLPDGSNGVFDPGWDVSQGKDKNSGKRYLQNHGLGVPFIEDVKLCAALGSFWPAVVPDSTRMFQPGKKPEGELWPWPTNVPLTDEELGLAPAEDGKLHPWDGVKDGPRIVRGRVRYPDINHVDYTTLGGRITAGLTSRVDLTEYKARVLAMASVYRALGVNFDHWLKERKDNRVEAANRLQLAKSQWAVLSFRKLGGSTDALRNAEQQTGAKMQNGETYYFHIYKHGKEEPDKQNPRFVLVEMKEQKFFFADREKLLMRSEGSKWERRELI